MQHGLLIVCQPSDVRERHLFFVLRENVHLLIVFMFSDVGRLQELKPERRN